MSMKPEDRAKLEEELPLPEMNQNILEYMIPEKEMFVQASQEVEEFHKNFDLQLIEDDQLENKERKRVYWKDLIAKEEQKAE